MIISIVNRKGSVTKTTTTLNLAAALRDAGCSVALLDLDTQHDLTELARRLKRVPVVEAGSDLRQTLGGILADYILIDCPPRLDTESAEGRLSLQAVALSDVCLIPTPLEYLPLRGLGRMMQTVQSIQKKYNANLQMRVLAAIYQPSVHKAERANLKARYPAALCKTNIPRSTPTVQALSLGKSVLDFAPDSPAARAYRKLAQEVMSWPKPTPQKAPAQSA
jgi:chromosome partitioning protein